MRGGERKGGGTFLYLYSAVLARPGMSLSHTLIVPLSPSVKAAERERERHPSPAQPTLAVSGGSCECLHRSDLRYQNHQPPILHILIPTSQFDHSGKPW